MPEDEICFFFFLIISTDVIALVEEIQKGEPLITASCKEYVINLVRRLQEKLGEQEDHKFYLFKVRVIFKIILEIWGVSLECCDYVFRAVYCTWEQHLDFITNFLCLFDHVLCLFDHIVIETEYGLVVPVRNSPKRPEV